jgi:hypothetical protein
MNRLTDWFSQRRFLVLLGSLVLLLIVQPILLDFDDSPMIFDTLLGLVTLALLFALTREKVSRVGLDARSAGGGVLAGRLRLSVFGA